MYEQSGVCPNADCAFAHGESDLRERQRARECAPACASFSCSALPRSECRTPG